MIYFLNPRARAQLQQLQEDNNIRNMVGCYSVKRTVKKWDFSLDLKAPGVFEYMHV